VLKKAFLFGVAFAVIANAATPMARADGSSCAATATEKKLAGAAKTSFMKKCGSDAQARCDAAAGEKKIYGAARTSFTKKCVSDAVGS